MATESLTTCNRCHNPIGEFTSSYHLRHHDFATWEQTPIDLCPQCAGDFKEFMRGKTSVKDQKAGQGTAEAESKSEPESQTDSSVPDDTSASASASPTP